MAIIVNGIEVADSIKSVEGTVPIGTIVQWSTTTAPEGWLLCNGASISRVEYSELFSIIGTTYGSVNSTTFTLPDFRGRVGVGLNSGDSDFNSLNKMGGSKYLQEHQHDFTRAPLYGEEVKEGNDLYATTSSTAKSITTKTSNTGTGNSGNLQPYITINYIIKAKEMAATSETVEMSDSFEWKETKTLKTWFGKPVYRFSFPLSSTYLTYPEGSTDTIQSGNFQNGYITDADMIVDYGGLIYSSDKTSFRKIPFVGQDINNQIRMDISNRTIRIFINADWSNYSGMLWVEYTKK